MSKYKIEKGIPIWREKSLRENSAMQFAHSLEDGDSFVVDTKKEFEAMRNRLRRRGFTCLMRRIEGDKIRCWAVEKQSTHIQSFKQPQG